MSIIFAVVNEKGCKKISETPVEKKKVTYCGNCMFSVKLNNGDIECKKGNVAISRRVRFEGSGCADYEYNPKNPCAL